MAKKRVKRSNKKSIHHESNAKAILAILILVLAFGVFWLFNSYQQNIISSLPTFQFFMLLVVILFTLLVGLLFLLNPQKK